MTDAVSLLSERLRANRCAVHGPVDRGHLGATIVAVLGALVDSRPVALPSAPDPLLDAPGVTAAFADWPGSVDVIRPDSPRWPDEIAGCCVGIAVATLAAADLGIVAVACSPGAPRSLTLLAPTILLVVRAETVHHSFEDAWGALASGSLASGALASGVSWISGPSRTGDLEMILTWGVHGPARVEVVIVTSDPPADVIGAAAGIDGAGIEVSR